MSGRKAPQSRASKAAQTIAGVPMGFAAVQFTVTETLVGEDDKVELVQRVFTTTVPRSWVYVHQHDKSKHFVKFRKGPIKLEEYDMILDYARREGTKPKNEWVMYPCNKLGYYKTYQESFQSIKLLVDTHVIVEPHLEPTDISAILNDVPSLSPVTAVTNNQNSPSSNAVNTPHKESNNILELNSCGLPSPANNHGSESQSIASTEQVQRSVEIIESNSEITVMNAALHSDCANEVAFINGDMQVLWDRIQFIFNKVNHSVQDAQTCLNKKLDKVNERLNSMDAKMTNVQNRQNELHVAVLKNGGLKKNPDFFGFEEFCRKYSLSVPFKTLQDFTAFDAKFTDDEEGQALYDDLKKHLISTTDNNRKVKENCSEIFKKFFDKAVLRNYTAQKKSNRKSGNKNMVSIENGDDTTENGDDTTENTSIPIDKLQFSKSTKFYTCFQDAFSNVYYNPPDKDGNKDPKIHNYTEGILLHDIGQVINDSKDWGGGRLERSRRSNENGPHGTSPKRPRRSLGTNDGNADNVLQTNQDFNIIQMNQ